MGMRHVPDASFPTSRIEEKEREVAATLFLRLVRYELGDGVTINCMCARQRLIDGRNRQHLVAVLHQLDEH